MGMIPQKFVKDVSMTDCLESSVTVYQSINDDVDPKIFDNIKRNCVFTMEVIKKGGSKMKQR